MDVVSLCPLRVGSVLWQQGRGAWVLTVVCKATFELLPGESRLFHEQEYPNEDDNFWNDDRERSLYSPSDMTPFKTRADVTLVGYAFAPQGKPVRSLIARLIIGEVDKSIEVFGERSWAQDGSLREGPRFTKMPLRYERAAGGQDTPNPVGMRSDARPDAYGSVPIPNLQPPGILLGSPSDFIEPVGYGPIAPSWPTRRDKLGPQAAKWAEGRPHHEPLPPDIDPAYFNSAPRDQQASGLRDTERLVLENLHPQHARLVTNLPGVHPRAFIDRHASAGQEIAMVPDTLWIDTDRAICTVTWRGRLAVESPRQGGRVLVAMETAGQRLTFADVERHANRSTDEEGTAMIEMNTADVVADSLTEPPMSGGASALSALSAPKPRAAPPGMAKPPLPPEHIPAPPPRRGPATLITAAVRPAVSSALPFVQSNAPPPPPPPPPPSSSVESRATPVPGDASPSWLSTSAPAAPAVVAPPAPVPAPPPPAPAQVAPPAQIPAPPPLAPRSESPWAGGGRLSDPGSSSPGLPPPPPPQPASMPGGMSALRSSLGASVVAPPPPVPMPSTSASDGAGGVVAASNAAASAWTAQQSMLSDGPAPAPAPAARPRYGARDATELLWFSPECLPDLRANAPWKSILDEVEPKEEAGEFDAFDEPPPKEEAAPAKEKKLVFAILTRADVTDPEGVNEAIHDAITDEGTFTPPLILVTGELHFPFDELETLKATVTAVTPLIAGDKKLKETVDTVNELLKTPWLESSTGVAENLTARVKEAFAQAQNRMLPPSYLDTHTERILMEQRHYQKRTVFGEVWIRSLLVSGGNSPPIPTYLPDALAKKLPMFQVFKARLIAEAHVQQDQYEQHPSALRVVALGRVIGPPPRARFLQPKGPPGS